MKDLLSLLEGYLWREVLIGAIPESRRRDWLNSKVFALWLVSVLIGIAVVIWWNKQDVFVSVLVAALLVAGGFIVLFFFLVLQIVWRAMRSRSRITVSQVDAGRIGGIFLIGLPLLVSGATAIYLQSISSFFLLLFLLFLSVVLIVLLVSSGPRLLPALETLWLAIKSVTLSLGLLRTLGPVLFITIVLPMFSQDIWRVVGQLTDQQLLIVVGILLTPAIVLAVIFLRSRISQIAHLALRNDEIMDIVSKIREIADSREQGLLSPEGWATSNNEIAWRHNSQMMERTRGKLGKRPLIGFSLVFMVSGLFIGVVIWIYLFLVLSTIIKPEILADWLQQPVVALNQLVSLFPFLTVSQGTIVILKVSFFLASLQVMVYSVSTATEDAYRGRLFEIEKQHVQEWLSAIAVYQELSTPGYQIWTTDKSDKRRSIVRHTIVLPPPVTSAQAQQACEHLCATEPTANLVVITAYEQGSDPAEYHMGGIGKRWTLAVNRAKNIHSFNEFDFAEIANELRYQHRLGLESIQQDNAIPDEWFGSEPTAIQIGKEIWTSDAIHDTIMHPYILSMDTNIFAEVALIKRLRTSKEYQALARLIAATMLKYTPEALLVDVTFYFRDRVDQLARLTLNKAIDYADYKDEKTKKSRTSRISKWW